MKFSSKCVQGYEYNGVIHSTREDAEQARKRDYVREMLLAQHFSDRGIISTDADELTAFICDNFEPKNAESI